MIKIFGIFTKGGLKNQLITFFILLWLLRLIAKATQSNMFHFNILHQPGHILDEQTNSR